MTRRSTTTSDDKTKVPYDGPLINGRPILTVQKVQKWFKDAYKVVPPVDKVAPITQGLNNCLLFETQWKDTPEFKQMRRSNPSTLRLQRISEALIILQRDIPVLIEDTFKIRPDAKDAGLEVVRRLLDSVNEVAPGFQPFRRPIPGAKSKGWHRIALNLGPLILGALESAGIEHAGFGNITSPAVEIIYSALEYLEVKASHAAIVDAMRDRKKPGKILR